MAGFLDLRRRSLRADRPSGSRPGHTDLARVATASSVPKQSDRSVITSCTSARITDPIYSRLHLEVAPGQPAHRGHLPTRPSRHNISPADL